MSIPVVLFPNLGAKIKSQYSKAIKSNSLTFTESETTEIEENGIIV
jgi:hypothetical protein